MSNEYVRMRKSTMDSIAKAIQEKEGSTDKISGAAMPAKIEAIGVGIPWKDIYGIQLWSLNIFKTPKVEITIPHSCTLASFCALLLNYKAEDRINQTVQELSILCSEPIDGIGALLGVSNYNIDNILRRVVLNVDTSNCSSTANMFNNCRALETIEGTPIDMTKVNSATGMFTYCYALREVRLKGELKVNLENYGTKVLTKESILSMMQTLSDTVDGKTLTLNSAAVDAAFETSVGAADGSSSSEWTAIVNSKSNWTIALRS